MDVLIDFLTFRNTYLICDILRRTIQSCEFRYVNVNRFKRKLQIRKSSMRYPHKSIYTSKYLSTLFIGVRNRRHAYCSVKTNSTRFIFYRFGADERIDSSFFFFFFFEGMGYVFDISRLFTRRSFPRVYN